MPRLKKRACTLNRGESGISRTANGSSNDSSISRWLKEPRSNGGLFQSNSTRDIGADQMCALPVLYSPPQCAYNVFTRWQQISQGTFNFWGRITGRTDSTCGNLPKPREANQAEPPFPQFSTAFTRPGRVLPPQATTRQRVAPQTDRRSGHLSPPPPPPSSPLMLLIMAIRGKNIAITMLPTITARNTIMMGSSREVMAATALSTSSS